MTNTSQQRIERILLAVIVVTGVSLRIAFPSAMSVEHFDEGVYASTSNFYFWFGANENFDYPDQYLYAPPLVPWLVQWSINIVGPSSFSPMLPSLLAGIATLLLIWWVARSWFGVEAGLSAAVLVAFSDVHLLYSRTALTDVLFCFWLLLAVYLIREAFLRNHLGWTLFAGIATGLAWWTKYNGWLPIAIGLAGLVPWMVLRSRFKTSATSANSSLETTSGYKCDHPASQLFVRWSLMAVIALVVWSPAFYQIQTKTPGGYAAVAANHRSYLVGLDGWWNAFGQQVANHRFLDGWFSCLSVGLAGLVLVIVWQTGRDHFTYNEDRPWIPMIVLTILSIAVAATVGASLVLGFLAAVGIGWSLLTKLRGGETTNDDPTSLALWLLAAWFVGLLLATPLYHPYPRLTLPWLMAAWLGVAALIDSLAKQMSPVIARFPAGIRWGGISIAAGASLFLLAWSAPRLTSRGTAAWQPRTGLEQIAAKLVSDAKRVAATKKQETDLVDFVLYVYAEPGLFYHLGAADALAQPAGNLDFVHPSAKPKVGPTFLVSGPHAHRSQQFNKQMKQFADKFELVATYPYTPSDLVRLNQAQPSRLDVEGQQSSWHIRLYRAK